MMFLTWLPRKLSQSSSSRRQRSSAVRCKPSRLRLEALEDRLLFSTYLVTNINDFGNRYSSRQRDKEQLLNLGGPGRLVFRPAQI